MLDSLGISENGIETVYQEYQIMAEYKMLQSEDIGGIYVIPSYQSSFLWFGVLFVRKGFYKDAIFRFNISLPENFPKDSKVPTVFFQNDVFHPFICPYTGTLDLSEAFPKWKYSENHVWQILKYIIFIFENLKNLQIDLDKKNLNKTAADLLTQNKGEFITKVAACLRLSKDKIYDPPPTDDKHYIIFEHYDDDVHRACNEMMKSNSTSNTQLSIPASGMYIDDDISKISNIH